MRCGLWLFWSSGDYILVWPDSDHRAKGLCALKGKVIEPLSYAPIGLWVRHELDDEQVWEDTDLHDNKASNTLRTGICVHLENNCSCLIWLENMLFILGKCGRMCVVGGGVGVEGIHLLPPWWSGGKRRHLPFNLSGLDLEYQGSQAPTSLPIV